MSHPEQPSESVRDSGLPETCENGAVADSEEPLNKLYASINSSGDESNITVLNLTNCGIDRFPSNIVSKLKLKQLILAHNKLSEIPSCLYSSLSSLELLDLSHNSIENFDVEPACCLTLKVLLLQNNKIHNLPQWILVGRAMSLEELIYNHNKIVNLAITAKVQLKKLELCNVGLLDCDLNFVKSLEYLNCLDIGNCGGCNCNKFKDLDSLFIKPHWRLLTTLKLNNLCLSVVPEGVFWLSSLIELSLVGCELSWLSQDIQYLVNLEFLDISNNQICYIASEFFDLPYLRTLKASTNRIQLIKPFKSKLKILDLYSNKLESFPFEWLEAIEFIDLEYNCFDTVEFGKDFDVYRIKKDLWRQSSDFNRYEGPRPVSPMGSESNSTVTEYSSSESDREQDEFNSSDKIIEEYWDEPVIKTNYDKNEEITASDEEWRGTDEPEPSKTPEFRVYIDEERLFCDAD